MEGKNPREGLPLLSLGATASAGLAQLGSGRRGCQLAEYASQTRRHNRHARQAGGSAGALPEPAVGVSTPAGLSRAAAVSLRDRRRRPWTEPACREVRQQSGSRRVGQGSSAVCASAQVLR
jgi:hypothetical protein